MTKKVVTKKKTSPIKNYVTIASHIKQRISDVQMRAAFAVNKELLKLYWYIGGTIVEQQSKHHWGTSTVDQLSKDIQNAFPGVGGFSRSNIFYMRSFYLAYEKVQQAVGQIDELPIFNIPWGHNVVLMQKLKNLSMRLWYAQQTIHNGWSRSMLETWIDSDLYKRQGKSITNFATTLPNPHSDLAQQSLKDPYLFDFLTLNAQAKEQELEEGLIGHIQKFLLELGQGFSFVGQQYHVQVGDQDFYIDLLFYHLKLRCFIVIELKNTAFIPEYAGKLNFYLSTIDDTLKTAADNPTIGLLLCKSKNNYVAEYALRDIKKPMGISSYATKLVESLPKEFKGKLPSVEEIEAELKRTRKVPMKKKRVAKE